MAFWLDLRRTMTPRSGRGRGPRRMHPARVMAEARKVVTDNPMIRIDQQRTAEATCTGTIRSREILRRRIASGQPMTCTNLGMVETKDGLRCLLHAAPEDRDIGMEDRERIYAGRDRARDRVRTPEARATENARQREWYRARSDEHKAAHAARVSESKRRRAEDITARMRAAMYGISPADQRRLLASQGGQCAICKSPLRLGRDKNTQLDHDHATGEVRGFLCASCNRGLGCMKDSPLLLRRAAAYLDRFQPAMFLATPGGSRNKRGCAERSRSCPA